MNTLVTATERLTRSRESLRQALHKVSSPPTNRNCTGTDNSPLDWFSNLKTMPGINLLLGIFQDWWARQPLRVTLTLAAQATAAVLQPIAQRHPVGLVAGAALAGGLVVLIRPWRWISTPALLTGMLPQLIAEVIKHLPVPPHADARPTTPDTTVPSN